MVVKNYLYGIVKKEKSSRLIGKTSPDVEMVSTRTGELAVLDIDVSWCVMPAVFR